MRMHSGILFKSALCRNEANKHSKSNPKPNSICKWQAVSPAALTPSTPLSQTHFQSHLIQRDWPLQS